MAVALRNDGNEVFDQSTVYETDEVVDEDMLSFGFDFTNSYFLDNEGQMNSRFSDSLSDFDTDSVPSSHSGSKSTSSADLKSAKVKKSNRKKICGSKLDQSLVVKHSGPNVAIEEASNPNRAPNLSRKFRDLKLYAFPSFDKCDSLVFFPSSMSRYLNSGNYQGLCQLMSAHLHKNCSVRISPKGNARISAPMFVKMFEIMNDAHPDSVLCVHTTKVIDNAIHARMYFKFTDCQVINNSLAHTISDATFKPMFARQRSDRFKDNMNLTFKTEAEKEALNAIVDSDVDLVVYGKADFRLCFDTNKKVTDIDFLCEFTSLSTTQVKAMLAGEEI